MVKLIKENKNLIRITLIAIAIILTLGLSYVALATGRLQLDDGLMINTRNFVGAITWSTAGEEVTEAHYKLSLTEQSKEVINYETKSLVRSDFTHFRSMHTTQEMIDYANNLLKDARSPGEASNITYNGATSILWKFANAFCCKHLRGVNKAYDAYIHAHATPNSPSTWDVTSLNELHDDDTYDHSSFSVEDTASFTDRQDTTENHSTHTYSNFRMVYVHQDMSLKCSEGFDNDGCGLVWPSDNVMPYAAIFGNKTDGEDYHPNGIQNAIWDVTGDGGRFDYIHGAEMIKVGRAIDVFEKNKEKIMSELGHNQPDVELLSVMSDSGEIKNIGTYYMKDNGTYRVGPFKMGKYVFAYNDEIAQFSGNGLVYPKTIGGIIGGRVVLTKDDGTETEIDILGNTKEKDTEHPKIVFEDPYGVETSKGIIGTSLYASSGAEYTDFLIENPYKDYPNPEAVFYIDIPKELCEGDGLYTSLKSMTFDYRDIETKGKGDVINLHYIDTKWDLQKNDPPSTCTYHCDFLVNDSESYEWNPEGTPNGMTSLPYYSYNHDYYYGSTGPGPNTTCYFNYNVTCSVCHGEGIIECPSCDGTGCKKHSGHTADCSNEYCSGGYLWKDCSSCEGYGYKDDGSFCSSCEGTGNAYYCRTCDGEGWWYCSSCGGDGYYTYSGSHTCYPVCYHSCSQYCQHQGFVAPEGFHYCRAGHYTGSVQGIGKGQPFLAIKEAEVRVFYTPYTDTFDIRLTTKLELNKYVCEVKHETNGEITFGDNVSVTELTSNETPTVRRDMDDPTKEADPVYVENGDLITFKVEVTNYQNCPVKVMLKDTISEAGADVVSRTFNDLEWIEVPGGTLDNPGRSDHTITIRTNADDGTYNNLIEIVTRNLELEKVGGEDSYNVDFVRTSEGYISPVVNINEILDETSLESKDFYTINDYNASIYKYISEYNAEMTEFNNSRGFTNEDNVLEDRYKQNDTLVTEAYKETYPVAVEKTETFKYAIRINNDSTKNPNNDVATRVRPSEIIDTLDEGLQYVDGSLVATMYKKDGSVEYTLNSNAYSISRGSIDTEYIIKLENKDGENFTCIEPGGYLLYEMTIKVVKTNMYLDKMANKAEFSKLTNINNLEEEQTTLPCPHCAGQGHTIGFKVCTLCSGNGYINETISCPYCSGSGTQGASTTCSRCNGTGYILQTCSHRDVNDSMYSSLYLCLTCNQGFTYQNANERSMHSGHNIELVKCNRCGATGRNGTGTYQALCPQCNGTSFSTGSGSSCTACGGDGQEDVNRFCPICHYSGQVTMEVNCTECGGSGTATFTLYGDRVIYNRDGSVDRNTGDREESSEYVRLKDLVIAGRVWLDKNKDGLMPTDGEGDPSLSNPPVDHEGKQTTEIVYSDEEISTNAEKPMKGIVVKLYYKDGTLVRTTKTDSTGLFTFAKDVNLNWLTPSTYERTGANGSTCTVIDSVQRVDKADKKDENKNYQANSQYYEYYIEYEYDGIAYKATEIYADDTHINDDGSYVDPYRVDSNAYEITSVREELNKKYEFISFNHAQNADASFTADLSFEKKADQHKSFLEIDPARLMTARSFINRQTNADQSQYVNGFYADGTTKYLWLKKFDASVNETPETEYLKYINLGLQEREDADISIMKDVYEIKTTVNGEEVSYSFDQLARERELAKSFGTGEHFFENGRVALGTNLDSFEFLNDFILKKPYALEVFAADFFYRIEDYEYEEVRNYKGEDSEMNIEVTYKITIDNTPITDDYRDSSSWKDTQLDLTVNEIVDFYDENYIPIKYGADGTMNESDPDNRISIKKANDVPGDDKNAAVVGTHTTDGEGNPYVRLIPQNVLISSAWYYDNNEAYDANGNENTRHYLTMSNRTAYSANNELFSRPEDLGYNITYITGMSDIKIHEGEQLDIYVKYTLDKDNGIEVNGKALDRTLEIIEKQAKASARCDNPIEGIATVGTYSMWYTTSGKEAAIVDCDSNVANIGYTENRTFTNLDDVDLYEDTTYKADYEIIVNEDNLRLLQGMVWDDSRSEAFSSSNTGSTAPAGISRAYRENGPSSRSVEAISLTQYSGNGLFSGTDRKNAEAKENEVVTHLYKTADITEEDDIKVRSAKAEYIEIIAIPDEGVQPSKVRYYEDKRPNATAQHIQNARTNEDGEYRLEGYIPGYYIVRFTYGDGEHFDAASYNIDNPYATEASTIASDMLIFNGQDYKTTKYTGVLDTVTDEDEILSTLSLPDRNDARDDELRRLQAIGYSERMINYKAEILKGLGNGLSYNNAAGKRAYLTPNDTDRNSNASLQLLLDRTNMYADTNRFYAKPEKIQKLFTKANIDSEAIYKRQNKEDKDKLYRDLFEVIYGDTINMDGRHYLIDNVDMGIEYRPETEVSLEKEIKYVKLQLASDSEDKPTVELFFDVGWIINAAGEDEKELRINEDLSTGYNVTQVIPNWYTRENNSYQLLSEFVDPQYEGQGWVNVQMDYEILQGAKVEIRYDYIMNNDSEVDRISKNLDELRYRENTEASTLYANLVEGKTGALEDILKQEYTAAGLASLYLKSIYGVAYKDAGDLAAAPISPSVPNITEGNRDLPSGENVVNYFLNEGDVIYRTRKRMANTDGNVQSGYYGMFLGSYYYTGEMADNDTVSQTKFVGILDYVDTDLRYNATEQEAYKYKDNKWTETYAEELRKNGLLKSGSTVIVNKGASATEANLVEGILNPNDILYGDLILTDSDRVKDIDEYVGEEDPTVNVDMTRFLYPTMDSRVEVRLEETLPSDIETNRPEVEYENLGEIVEITTQTGRRTNFDTTIGNVYFDLQDDDPSDPKIPTGRPSSPEFIRATFEPDTAATELISINPNPGMTRKERQIHVAIKNTLNTTMVATLVLAVVVIGTLSTTVVVKKIKNKPIK